MIGVLGGNGFIGSSLIRDNVISITRDNYNSYKGCSFDIFINAAGNNKSYWANMYPNEDFKTSTVPVYDSIFDFKIKKYIYISSIAVYDNTTSYGFNKKISEDIIIKNCESYLILRCSNVIDKSSSIGIIYDIRNDIPLFLTKDSRIQFITRNMLSEIVFELIKLNLENKIINVGGIGSVSIERVQNIFGKDVNIKPEAKYRKYEMNVDELNKLIKLKTSEEYVADIL